MNRLLFSDLSSRVDRVRKVLRRREIKVKKGKIASSRSRYDKDTKITPSENMKKKEKRPHICVLKLFEMKVPVPSQPVECVIACPFPPIGILTLLLFPPYDPGFSMVAAGWNNSLLTNGRIV